MPGDTPRARWGSSGGTELAGPGRGENRCFQTSDMAPGLLSETETSEGSRLVRSPLEGHSTLPVGGASQ